MKKISLSILSLICFASCNLVQSTAVLMKTSYLTEDLKTQRNMLDVKKNDIYKVTTIIECPTDQKVLYKIQNIIRYKDDYGNWISEGGKSAGHITSLIANQEVRSGTSWSYNMKFKTPIKDGKFIVKVGDSVILAKVLTGRHVEVDYGFQLP